MTKTQELPADSSGGEQTGKFQVPQNFFSAPAQVSSSGNVIVGIDAQSYIPVVKDASVIGRVAVVISLKTPEEQFMEWANNRLQDAHVPAVDSKSK